jgi:hypothetical protein
MESTKVTYGLKLKDKDRLLGIKKTHNEGKSNCGEYTFQLDEWEDEKWFVDDEFVVLMAKWTSEVWYNSSYEAPVNPYHPLELEVVKVVSIYVSKETNVIDELAMVNLELKEKGYAEIDEDDYL